MSTSSTGSTSSCLHEKATAIRPRSCFCLLPRGLCTRLNAYSVPLALLCYAVLCSALPSANAFYLQSSNERASESTSYSEGPTDPYLRYVANPAFDSPLIWACNRRDATHYCTSGGKYCFMKRGVFKPLCKCKHCYFGPRCERQDIQCIIGLLTNLSSAD